MSPTKRPGHCSPDRLLRRSVSEATRPVLRGGPLPRNIVIHNVQRFSLGGAAHRPVRLGSTIGVRAGEGKTCWAKPRPRTAGLWALNAAGSFAGVPSGQFGRPGTRERGRFGRSRRANQATVRSEQLGSDRLGPVSSHQCSSRYRHSHPDLAVGSASCGWTVGSGS